MPLVSKATERNWAKLNVNISSDKLTSRANKKLSKKSIIPVEYLLHSKNKELLLEALDRILLLNAQTEDIFASLCVVQLKTLVPRFRNKNFQELGEALLGKRFAFIEEVASIEIPADEFDFLGALYQSVKTEGQKNRSGSYFTPPTIARDMLNGYDRSKHTLLDPCCGSGAILLASDAIDPNSLFGCDVDEVSVAICKTNLLIKYSDIDFIPNIYTGNFLLLNEPGQLPLSESAKMSNDALVKRKYNYISTNPPWGAEAAIDVPEIPSGESSSIFFYFASKLLSLNGTISFLLPKSILNIASHADIRFLMKQHFDIEEIHYYPNVFSGVTTEFVNIVATTPKRTNSTIKVARSNQTYAISQNKLGLDKACTFRCLREIDEKILSAVASKCNQTLKESTWALGIVTGDNKNKLADEMAEGLEPIFTGKEVTKFKLKPPQKFLKFEPDNLQQVAKIEYYRHPEKLVYKFISKKLVFALDTSGSLCLNSANILIPKLNHLSNKALIALLNSSLYQYLYIVLFDDVKILKKNLMELPLPTMSADEDSSLGKLVQMALDTEMDVSDTIESQVCDYFELSNSEITRIQEVVNGKAY